MQTAVKTGTSTDYRDAWVLGYNARYVVGIWMGNLDNQPMDGVTGSIGPALTLRAVFNALGGRDIPRALYLSPRLAAKQICTTAGQEPGSPECFPRTEYFMPGTDMAPKPVQQNDTGFAIIRPTEDLHIAYDPRRPAHLQAFEFSARKSHPNHLLEWRVNDQVVATTDESKILWPLTRGKFTLTVTETDRDGSKFFSDKVGFLVK